MPSNRLGPRMAARTLLDTCEVWRDPDATPGSEGYTPHANSDSFGFPVKTTAPDPGEDDPVGRRKVADYKCELAQAEPEKSHVGGQAVVAAQALPYAPWVVSLFGNGSAAWPAIDIKAGDELHIGGQALTVIDAGGTGTHGIFQLVRCQEVK